MTLSCASNYVRPTPKSTPTERIEQLYYLIGSDGVSLMLEYEPKYYQMLLDTFWYYQDPTPFTEENEYRDAYYNRIDLCLTLFDSCPIEGWKTDRGKCLIILGYPDNIRDEPMYEHWYTGVRIWEYWTRRYELIFVETYAGCYKLLNPPYEVIGW